VITTTITSKEFETDPRRARKVTSGGPVFISERGKHAFALLTLQEYRRIGGGGETLADLLFDPEAAKIDFEPTRMGDEPIQAADFS